MTRFSDRARAKINLTLHVGPAQNDGYHPLESLVVFADIGDGLSVVISKGDEQSLSIDGPFSAGLSNTDNLILQTAVFLDDKFAVSAARRYHLTKNLPVASGIGGGSADAAAVIRLRARETTEAVAKLSGGAQAIGADVHVCIQSRTCIMSGIGEGIAPLPDKGQVPAVLINPGVAVSTGKIFGLFDQNQKPDESWKTGLPVGGSLVDMCKAGRNDLQQAAAAFCPKIDVVIDELNQQAGVEIAACRVPGPPVLGYLKPGSTPIKQRKISRNHILIGGAFRLC